MDLSLPVDRSFSVQRSVASHEERSAGPSKSSNGSFLSSGDVRAFLIVAALTIFVARLLAPAIPGTQLGSAQVVEMLDRGAALLSQFASLLGVVLAAALLMAATQGHALNAGSRLLVVCATGALLAIHLLASLLGSARSLTHNWIIGLSLSAIAVGLIGAGTAIRASHSRAIGLVLALTALAASTHIYGRLLAFAASDTPDPSMFFTAQVVATAGFCFNTARLLVIVFWLVRAGRRDALIALVPACLCAGTITLLAVSGANVEANTASIVADRIIGLLSSHPLPLIPAGLRVVSELLALCLGAALLLLPRQRDIAPWVVAAALLSGGTPDVPFNALLLGIAGLAAVLTTQTQRARD